MGEIVKLYGYWRSSAAYRVRIGLNLKRVAYESVPVHLMIDGGRQHTKIFHELNPQELIPVLVHGGRVIRQSMAILEYLDETFIDADPILPATARERARARGLAMLIACDIHPLNNLRVQKYLESEFNATPEQRETWILHWVREGFNAFEEMLVTNPSTGEFCEGDRPSMADICLVPQVYNAKRFKLDMSAYPTINRIVEVCSRLPEFIAAAPENQADAE